MLLYNCYYYLIKQCNAYFTFYLALVFSFSLSPAVAAAGGGEGAGAQYSYLTLVLSLSLQLLQLQEVVKELGLNSQNLAFKTEKHIGCWGDQ